MSMLQDIKDLIIEGRTKKIEAAVQEALDNGVEANELLSGMIDAMNIVGEDFKTGEIFIPEVLVCAKAMKLGVGVLKPHLASGVTGAMGKVVIGTVEGDLHDIGKNLVAMLLESAGFAIIDLGIDVTAEQFIEAVKENSDTKIVAMSALLTTTMTTMGQIVAEINQQDFRKDIKIMVGGAPVTAEYAEEIGADAYTPDAASAAQCAKAFVA